MARPDGAFRTEAAGSLTPELEGREKSLSHPQRTGKQSKQGRKKNGRDALERS